MADLRITELPRLDGGSLAAADPLAVADLSASETKQLTAKDLIQFGVALIDDESIPSEKLQDVRHEDIAPTGGAGQFLAGPTVIGGRITARRIAPTDLPPATTTDLGAVIPRIGLGVDGNGTLDLLPAQAAVLGGISVPAAAVSGLSLSIGGELTHANNAIPPGAISGITFDDFGHITATRALVGADLPPATATTIGAVSIVPTGGLAVSDLGALRHSFTAAPITRSGITVDGNGHVTAITPLISTDLPIATTDKPGAVMVPSDGQLVIDGTGAVRHIPSAFGGGTFTKVLVDAFGHVRGASALAADDIPPIDASKIASGTLAPTLIPKDAINGVALSDYSISFIGETTPAAAEFIGQLWLQESTSQLRMWNGNSWWPCGFGAVMQNNLRFGGTFSAKTGLINSVTPLGREAGLTAGQPLPAASLMASGVYLLCLEAGNSTSVLPGTEFTIGDWILNGDPNGGWIRVDVTSTSGGGGTTFDTLDALLDVTINTPATGDVLMYDNTLKQWVNRPVADPGLF